MTDQSKEQQQLAAVRERIDALDAELLRLINERAACAQKVADIKQSLGEDTDYYRPEREAQILRRVREENKGPLASNEIARLFREIISACLALERPLSIAYLGPAGTYTQAAVMKHFGHSVNTLGMRSIDDVFREVESGNAHYGVVPVENSTEGVVNHTLDKFLQSPLQICGEVQLRIELHLMSGVADLGSIKTVYAHQQALAQSRRWLDANLPHADRVPVASNGEAARMVSEEGGPVAAVAGGAAADLYSLNILARNIEDEPGNTTRFLVIGKQSVAVSGDDKTSLLVSVHNESGALYRILEPISQHNLSMTRIESRPSRRGVWDYVFFIDIVGHQQDPEVAAALLDLQQRAAMVKVLGSYPRAVL